jgi:hypothetical protein
LLGAYTGSAVNGLTLVDDDDDGGTGDQSLISFTAVAGTTYRIAVDGFNGGGGAAEGLVDLHLNQTSDTSAPDTQIDSGPVDGSTITTSIATLGFSTVAPETNPTFECRLDGSAFQSCASPTQLAALGNGSHTFDVRATDQAGNTDPTPASRTFVVAVPSNTGPSADTQRPETTMTSQPAAKIKVRKAANVAFGFTANESATFACSLDSSLFEVCTSPKQYSKVKPGNHTFKVVATDPAGNIDSTPAVYSFKVKKKKRKR